MSNLTYPSVYKALKRQLRFPRPEPQPDESGRRPWLRQTFTVTLTFPHSPATDAPAWMPEGDGWVALVPGYAWARVADGRSVEVLGDNYSPQIPGVDHSLIGGIVDPDPEDDPEEVGPPIWGLMEKRHRLRHEVREGTLYEVPIPPELRAQQKAREALWEMLEETTSAWSGIDVSGNTNFLPDGRRQEIFVCTIYDNEVQVGRYAYGGTEMFWWQLARYAEFFFRLGKTFPGLRLSVHRGRPGFAEEWSTWHRGELLLRSRMR